MNGSAVLHAQELHALRLGGGLGDGGQLRRGLRVREGRQDRAGGDKEQTETWREAAGGDIGGTVHEKDYFLVAGEGAAGALSAPQE